jgi:hypothetical protein
MQIRAAVYTGDIILGRGHTIVTHIIITIAITITIIMIIIGGIQINIGIIMIIPTTTLIVHQRKLGGIEVLSAHQMILL